MNRGAVDGNLTPETIAYYELCNLDPTVQMIGDCRRLGKVTNAVSDRYYMALDIS